MSKYADITFEMKLAFGVHLLIHEYLGFGQKCYFLLQNVSTDVDDLFTCFNFSFLIFINGMNFAYITMFPYLKLWGKKPKHCQLTFLKLLNGIAFWRVHSVNTGTPFVYRI